MKILVTGADGFLGSFLAKRLARRQVVKFVGSSAKAQGIPINLLAKIPTVKNVDVCFHFAALTDLAECERNPRKAMLINAEGTRKIAEMLRKNSEKPFLVYASTLSVCTSDAPIGENTPISPKGAYALSKAKGEEIVEEYSKFFPTASLRFAFPYGLGEGKNRLMEKIAANVLKKKPVSLNVGGKPYCNPVFVQDALDACTLLMQKPPAEYKAYSIGGAEVANIKQIALLIGRVLREKVFFKQKTTRASNLIADNSLAERNFGYSPKTTLSEGLRKTLAGNFA